jgi:hypothetical protein
MRLQGYKLLCMFYFRAREFPMPGRGQIFAPVSSGQEMERRGDSKNGMRIFNTCPHGKVHVHTSTMA